MVKATGPYDIEAVRSAWIGKAGPITEGRYPVEHDPIRRHCHMVDDKNPLFLDSEFAAGTKYGGVIVPPVAVDYFAGKGIWPPSEASANLMQAIPTLGDRMINLSQTIEFLEPVHIGDKLSSQTVVADVLQKAIRLDPKAVCIVIETRVTNQEGTLVGRTRNMLLTHRTPEEVAADKA